jgi:hypothetical protein
MSDITTVLSFCHKSGSSGKELAMMLVSTTKPEREGEDHKNQEERGTKKRKTKPKKRIRKIKKCKFRATMIHLNFEVSPIGMQEIYSLYTQIVTQV